MFSKALVFGLNLILRLPAENVLSSDRPSCSQGALRTETKFSIHFDTASSGVSPNTGSIIYALIRKAGSETR